MFVFYFLIRLNVGAHRTCIKMSTCIAAEEEGYNKIYLFEIISGDPLIGVCGC